MKKLLFVFLLSFASLISFSQTIVHDTILLNQYTDKMAKIGVSNIDSLLYYFSKAEVLFQKEEQWENYVAWSNYISHCLKNSGKYELLQKQVTKTLDIAKNRFGTNHYQTAAAINNIGVSNRLKGTYDEAIKFYKQAHDIHKVIQSNPQEFSSLYQNISVCYRSKGDSDQAITYLNQALKLEQNAPKKRIPIIAKINLDLGHLYRDRTQFSQAKSHYNKGLEFLSSIDIAKDNFSKRNLIYCHQSMAKVFLSEKNIAKSLFHINKAVDLEKGASSSGTYFSYEIMGEISLSKKDYSAAAAHFKKSESLAIESFNTFSKHKAISKTIKNIARLYAAQGNQDQAIAHYQEALIKISLDFDHPSPISNPPVDQILSKIEALEIISGKAESLFKKYESDHSRDNLQSAFENFHYASHLIQELRNSFLTAGSKNLLAKHSLEVYERGIKTALELYKSTGDDKYAEKAFQFAEQNKARLIEESLKEDYAKIAGGLPTEALEKEHKLTSDINFYQKQINLEQSKTAKNINQEKIKLWTNTLFDLKNEYNELISSFEKNYPQYYQLKHETKELKIEDIRAQIIDNRNALLEYFVGEKHIYLFCISNDDFNIFELPKPKDIELQISELRSIISQSPFKSDQAFKQDQETFTTIAYGLYQSLLSPAIDKLPENINHFTIIPDDILAFLPFEVLLSEPALKGRKSYSTEVCSYLFTDYSISYNYSAGLFLHYDQGKQVGNQIPFLGFAPSFQKGIAAAQRDCTNDEVYSLECNATEVDRINLLFNGESNIGFDASTKTLFEKIQQTNILHLATHACIDEENPELNKIYFTDNYITGTEINNLKLHAELAVLSACNTGSGKLIKGEGVMSLSRDFILAGCSSTLMSLWSVDDCTTSDIMVEFYKGIKDGLTKDEALRMAKITHLNNANKIMSHPYYWAAFVQSGSTSPIQQSGFSFNYWWLLGLLLIPLFFFWQKKYKTA